MRKVELPKIGMRMVKTAVAVMLSYALFVPFGLLYREELGGVWGQLGPLYACIACIVCTQSSLGQTMRQGVSRFIGVAVGGVLGVGTLLLEDALSRGVAALLPEWAEGSPWLLLPMLGTVCLAGLWFCLLIKRPAACPMACIVPCVILITGVTGTDRYYYAAARIIETVVGVGVAFLVNAVLPNHQEEKEKERRGMKVELNNGTQKLCVIGDPVEHSRSPLIHNTMLGALGRNYVYLCQHVARGETAAWLEAAKTAGYAGFNATMPHKEALVELVDELDGDAALFGAVNTVCIRDGKSYGYNTDGAGFVRALDEAGIPFRERTVLLLGAGGAAKAVSLKLAAEGAGAVFVCNRTVEKAAALCALDRTGRLVPADFRPETLCGLAARADLLVNCTSLGMAGTGSRFEDLSFIKELKPDAAVCDLIYAPAETELLRCARENGHKTMNGMSLLIHQAVLALEQFTRSAIDPGEMAPLVRAALEEQTALEKP